VYYIWGPLFQNQARPNPKFILHLKPKSNPYNPNPILTPKLWPTKILKLHFQQQDWDRTQKYLEMKDAQLGQTGSLVLG